MVLPKKNNYELIGLVNPSIYREVDNWHEKISTEKKSPGKSSLPY